MIGIKNIKKLFDGNRALDYFPLCWLGMVPGRKKKRGRESMKTKQELIDTLRGFTAQRSGLNTRDYVSGWNDKDGLSALRADQYRMRKHGQHARQLLRAVELSGITADDIVRESAGQRLEVDGESGAISFTACQYFPTEYRAAVCRLCAAVLWEHYREDFAAAAKAGESAGDAIRRKFRAWFGRGMASTWFN
jgi:hypothetical protein